MSSYRRDMRARIIRTVTFLGGIYFFLDFVCPEAIIQSLGLVEANEPISSGFTVVAAMAVGLGLFNLVAKHGMQLVFKRKGWPFSVALLLGLSSMLVVTTGQWIQGLRTSREIQTVQLIGDFAKRIVEDAQGLAEKGSAGVKSVAVDGKLPAVGVRVAALQRYTETQVARIDGQLSELRRSSPVQTIFDELQQSGAELGASARELTSISQETLTPNDVEILKAFTQSAAKVASLYSLVMRRESGRGVIQRLYELLYNGLFIQLGAAMFALLGVYIAAAAYRAFRIKTVESALMMIAAVVVMLGQVAFGKHIYEDMPALRQWLLEVPNSAAFRAIRLGAGVAGLMLAIRMWLSIESSSFSSRKK